MARILRGGFHPRIGDRIQTSKGPCVVSPSPTKMITEIRQIITDQIDRHVAATQAHREWLADDIAGRVCAIVSDQTEQLRVASKRLTKIQSAMQSTGRSLGGNDGDVEWLAVGVPMDVYHKEGKEAAIKAAFL